jgi:hypothetical protein
VLPDTYVTSTLYVFGSPVVTYGVPINRNTEYTYESNVLLTLKNPEDSDVSQFEELTLWESVVLKNKATVFDAQFDETELSPA